MTKPTDETPGSSAYAQQTSTIYTEEYRRLNEQLQQAFIAHDVQSKQQLSAIQSGWKARFRDGLKMTATG